MAYLATIYKVFGAKYNFDEKFNLESNTIKIFKLILFKIKL